MLPISSWVTAEGEYHEAMVRFWIALVAVAIGVILFALIDALMSDRSRVRGVSKPIWVLIILLVPVIGAVLWFAIGKTRKKRTVPIAPDDDPKFSGQGYSAQLKAEMDARLRDLEEQLKALDDEVYPGEEKRDSDQGETR